VSTKFFQQILQITNEEVFHTGAWRTLQVNAEGDTSPDGLIAYEWRSDKAWKIIVVNLSEGTSQGRIPLATSMPAGGQYNFFDQVNDVTYLRSGDEVHNIGLFVRRDKFQAHLFDITAAQ
jgi:hypothetical protein